jgi:hypothetical protein
VNGSKQYQNKATFQTNVCKPRWRWCKNKLQLIFGVFGNERRKTSVMVLLGRRERRMGGERRRRGAEEEGKKVGRGGDEVWKV